MGIAHVAESPAYTLSGGERRRTYLGERFRMDSDGENAK